MTLSFTKSGFSDLTDNTKKKKEEISYQKERRKSYIEKRSYFDTGKMLG